MKYILLLLFFTFTIFGYSQPNYAIPLNGSNQYVNIGAPIPNNSSYTKEAWVNVGAIGGAQNIISSTNTPLWLNNGNLSAGHGGNYSQVTGGSFPAGQWVHAAVTYDAATTTMRLYRNGVQVGINTSVSSNYANETTFIGSHFGGNSLINGMIDEVRIWDYALTAAQLKHNMFRGPSLSEPGLLAYYKCDDGSGSVVTDATGNINGNYINASPGWSASPVTYNMNALHFDGANDHVVVPHSVSSDFTLEYWMRTTSTGPGGSQWFNGNGIVDAEVGGGTNDWGTSLVGSKLAFGIGNPDQTIFSTADVNTGNWVHVAVSWQQSSGTMKMYINGADQGTFPAGSTNTRNAPPRITFGMLQTNNNMFNGSIDEVRIWNVVRTQPQIQVAMNFEINPAAESSLVAYYSFNQGIPDGTNTGLVTAYDMKGDNNGTLNNFSLNSTTSNFVTQNNSLFVLPLQWRSFTAEKQGEKSLLRWITEQEQHTKDFVVQHSKDGRDWVDMAVIPATGNTNSQSTYQFRHENPVQGINYYRIRQRDLDGQSSYSSTRTLFFNTKGSVITLFQNPVVSGTLQFNLSDSRWVSFYSSDGKIIWRKFMNAGVQSADVSRLAKGIYILVTDAGSERILVQ